MIGEYRGGGGGSDSRGVVKWEDQKSQLGRRLLRGSESAGESKRRYYVGPPENFPGNNFDQRLRSIYATKLKETTKTCDDAMLRCGEVVHKGIERPQQQHQRNEMEYQV